MKRPDARQFDEIAKVAVHNRYFVEWLDTWRQEELESLPTRKEDVATYQGRCLVLAELVKVLKESPEKAANSSRPRTP